MSHLFFPTQGQFKKPYNVRHKPTEMPRQLSYIIRGGTDAIEALETFLELLFESPATEHPALLSRPGYLAFDAHVGDTACQLRACMLLEVTKLLRSPEAHDTVEAIRHTVNNLNRVLENAQRLIDGLLQLDWIKIRNGGLEALSIPQSGLSTDELLTKLGWYGTQHRSFRYDSCNASSNESLLSQDTPVSTRAGQPGSIATSSSRSTPDRDSDTSHDHDGTGGMQWDPLDSRQTVRLVTYSYVLSKYKQLTSFGGVYRATLKPELAVELGQKLVQREFGRQFVRPNKRAIGEEFTYLQRYISELSCSWLESQAHRLWSLHTEHHSLLRSTIRSSAKGISSVSSYVGYLVLRSLWAEESTPIIVTTTRFCPAGKSTSPIEYQD